MARFAFWKPKASDPDTLNLAGGRAHALSPKLEFATALMTTFTTDTFYASADAQVARIAALTRALEDPLFAAKAAVFTRSRNGLRSVSHVVAGELAARPDVKGKPWLRTFFRAVAQRPDDVTETLAYLKASGNPQLRKLSNALKRGFGDALAGFDAYQLAKYRRADRDPSLVDAVNLLHPRSTPALQALMTGALAPAQTWETRLSEAGRTAAAQGLSEQAKADLKGEAWVELLKARKLGYLACLRNLRNIAEQAPTAFPLALKFLTDPRQVEKSKVLPFQILTAIEAVKGSAADTPPVHRALDEALELSLMNVPAFEGRTLIAVDVSGSMAGRPVRIASVLAAVLYKSQAHADVILFDTVTKALKLHPRDSLTTLASTIAKEAMGGGTDFRVIFKDLKRAYDRILILSDMQAWVGHQTPAAELAAYRKKFKADPRIFSFDLTGHGSIQFPEAKVFALAGFTDAVLGVLKELEQDPAALVKAIEAVAL
ncbi:MAG: TROVE domain-containing protein [Holophagaceae bacterium]